MGLKFKKFKAKLNWKTKETVPEVVCLRYQIHSEFDEQPLGAPVPATSGNRLGTNDVIKQKKPAVKPLVQNVFEHKTSTPNTLAPITPTSTTSIINNSAPNPPTTVEENNNSHSNNHNIIDQKLKKNGVVPTNQNTFTAKSDPVATKGILKKPTTDETVVEEIKSNQTNPLGIDDYKKSALIFMTENHDDNEEPGEEKSNTEEINNQPDLLTNTTQGIPELHFKTTAKIHQEKYISESKFSNLNKEEEIIEAKTEEVVIPRKDKTNRSDSESEQADTKTVRWRETIIEINTPNLETNTQQYEESADDFQVHFVKHHNFSTNGLQPEGAETEESEPEDNDAPPVKSYYGNRDAYSSQAASIFFAGEEPEPAPRVRNVSKELEDGISGDSHSAV